MCLSVLLTIPFDLSRDIPFVVCCPLSDMAASAPPSGTTFKHAQDTVAVTGTSGPIQSSVSGSFQVTSVEVEGYTTGGNIRMQQHFGPTNLADLDLTTIHFSISKLHFGTFRALESTDTAADLWKWMERHAAALKNLHTLHCDQRIHQSPFIQYMNDQLGYLHLAYEMSNYQSARYDFVNYTCVFRHGSTPKDLHTHLSGVANQLVGDANADDANADDAVRVPPFGRHATVG